ncbi:MAG: crossover junction endodeoxyribonuclease RuvC [Planctomycetota bacterium]|nr:crossover junction endodeoxyribonuclease RuvC [Planctomycetota bacterium]
MPMPPPEPRKTEPTSVRVLGIDPGTRVVGWAVVEATGSRYRAVAFGVLRADTSKPVLERLAALTRELRTLTKTHAPDEAAIEEAFHGRDARAALAIGEARGALSVALADAGLTVASYANNVVKKAVTGAGRARKEQVQASVRRILALAEPPSPLDASDALAVAVCHLQRRGAMGPGAGGGLAPRLREALEKQGIQPRRARGRGRGRAR